MKRWCVRHNQACDYANSNGYCNVSACQTVIGGDRKMTNREWLQTLTDEQLAYIMTEVGCGCCVYTFRLEGDCPNMRPEHFNTQHCIDGTTKWLKAEHKDDEL